MLICQCHMFWAKSRAFEVWRSGDVKVVWRLKPYRVHETGKIPIIPWLPPAYGLDFIEFMSNIMNHEDSSWYTPTKHSWADHLAAQPSSHVNIRCSHRSHQNFTVLVHPSTHRHLIDFIGCILVCWYRFHIDIHPSAHIYLRCSPHIVRFSTSQSLWYRGCISVKVSGGFHMDCSFTWSIGPCDANLSMPHVLSQIASFWGLAQWRCESSLAP